MAASDLENDKPVAVTTGGGRGMGAAIARIPLNRVKQFGDTTNA